MTEGMPPTPEEIRQLDRDLMEKVLDKAASDPVWKERFLEDSEAAIQEAGFPELRSLQKVYETAVLAQASEDEVQGHDMSALSVPYIPVPMLPWWKLLSR